MNHRETIDDYAKRLTILYVEDDPVTREQLARFLSRRVGSVITANTGIAGLEAYRIRHPHIVITDILMPEMDGLSMAEEIHKIDRIVPIIVTTAFEQKEYLLRAINIGVDKYVTKPVDSKRLLSALFSVISQLHADTMLQESELRFRQIYEHIHAGLAHISLEFTIVHANQAYCRMLGYSEEELIGRHLREITHPEDIEENYRLQTLLASGTIDHYQMEKRFIHKDGHIIYGLIVSNLICNETGKPLYFLGSAIDITDRKRAEEALRKRIIALTQPLDDLSKIQFFDLFSIEDIQHLQDVFAETTGVASIITHPDGTPITRPSRFCRLCMEIIRKTKKGLANCYKSDAVIGCYNPSGPIVQICLSGGLWDAGASITVGGKHIANWLIGQVKNEVQDENRMLLYADEIGADRDAFYDALKEVPAMSRPQFDKIAGMLFLLANELSTKAYQNVVQARFIHKNNQGGRALEKFNDSLHSKCKN